MALVFAVYLLLIAVFYVPGYVLTGLGLYAIASRRGIEQPWRAWVPGVNLWLIGCISDQYQAIVVGKQKYKRLTLLGLLLAAILMSASMTLMLGSDSNGGKMALLLVILYCAVVITLAVIGYMALYDLYCSCDPKHAELYLVLSIVLPITAPVFLFLCRKKDLGFPL